jgi:ABC-type uncharacterized transport system involved in gliding motility auxiliary subunit
MALFLAAVGLLAWLSTRYHAQIDWTAGGRNTLSDASRVLLGRLDGPVRITAYATEDGVLRDRIRDLVERYRRHKADIALELVNPEAAPDQVRELGIAVDGELLVEFRGRREHVQSHSEQTLTNALQRVARAGERHLAFLSGHGERDPKGQKNHDLGEWGRQLTQRGFKVETLNLAEAREVPARTTVLVLAGPQVGLLPGEVELVRGYLDRGGNLLWLLDPGPLGGLEPVADPLGLEVHPGTIVDPTGQLLGVDNPAVVVVTRYPFHDVLSGLELLTVFPTAAGLQVKPPAPWEAEPLLTTSPRAWSETGELRGEVRLDPASDVRGPLDIGFALVRPRDAAGPGGDGPPVPSTGQPQQRVVILGDGDFLANAFLGNGGNLDLGMNVVNWLASDDVLVAIPAKTAPDLQLSLSAPVLYGIGTGFLLVLPAVLIGTGLVIWYRRRRR